MKHLIASIFLLAFVVPAYSQPCIDRACVYLRPPEELTAPTVQIDAIKNIGLLVYGGEHQAIFSSANKAGATSIWTVGINGANALKVQGPADFDDSRIIKDHAEGHRLKLYDVNTGELVMEFEYSFE